MKFPDLASRDLGSMENPEVTKACNGFLEQVLSRAPLEGVAVVLLDENRSTSRVVFSWQAREASGGARQKATKSGDRGAIQKIDSSCLALAGSAGIMGAVLIRTHARAGPPEIALFHSATQRLAGRLEDSDLRQRLDRSDREARALSRINGQAASGAPTEAAYQCFVDEIKGLVESHRFTFFLVDRKAGLLTCAFQTDAGGQTCPVDGPRPLAGTGCERLMSASRSLIVDDLQAFPGDIWPELSGEPGFRSAIIAPLVHEGDVLGVAVVRNRYPKAFGPVDESLMSRAVDLLVPAFMSPAVDDSSALDRQAVSREFSDILATGQRIEDILNLFADAAGKLIQFDVATVAWLDPNGYDIHTFQSKLRTEVDPDSSRDNVGPIRSSLGRTPPEDSLVSIQAGLQFGGEDLGTLTLCRSEERPFGHRDLNTLDLVATHMAVAVQNDRLNRRQSWLRPEAMADLAHALRTPLSSIKGYSSSLLQTDISWAPEGHKEFLETIDREADQLNRVIDDFMTTVAGVRSEPQAERSVTTLDTLLRLAEAELLTSAGWHRVVRFQRLPNQSPVLVDQTRITQVLVYLLRCAASSSPEEAELLVRVSNRGDRVEVTIGAREKNVGQTGGAESTAGITSGMGNFPLNPPVDPMDDALRLSVCRTVVAAHGAELEVGIPGEWERMFSFKLPVFTTDL